MAIADLELTFAVNPFGKGIEVERKPEVIEKVEQTPCELIENIIEKYIELKEASKENSSYIISSINIVLNPAQIELLFQQMITRELLLDPSFDTETGFFFAHLIDCAYQSGHNNFVLSTEEPMNNLGFCLKAMQNDPILMTINGYAYNLCGAESTNIILNLYGQSNDLFGFKSRSNMYNIYGNVGGACGYMSRNCHFNIHGHAGDHLGKEATESIFTIHGNIGKKAGVDSNKCIYRTTIEKTFDQLIQYIPRENKIHLLDDKGKVIRSENR